MHRSSSHNGNPFQGDQRGDPLAGWGQENFAAPHPQQQDGNIPVSNTNYDEELRSAHSQSGGEQKGQEQQPTLRAPNPPAGQFLQVPLRQDNAQLDRGGSGNGNVRSLAQPAPAQPASGSREPKYTKEEKNACPHGDTRWPPPGEYTEALQFFYEEKGKRKRLFYNLIHDNTAPKATTWRTELVTTAKAAQAKKKDTLPQMSLNAALVMKQGMKKISFGARGSVWLLDEGYEHVVECLTIVQKQSPYGAVRVAEGDYQRFQVFGLGVKGAKGDVMLLSEKVEVP